MEPEYSIFFDRPSVFAKDKEEKNIKGHCFKSFDKISSSRLTI